MDEVPQIPEIAQPVVPIELVLETVQAVETVPLNPTAQIPQDEPLGSSLTEPAEQSADSVASSPVSAEPISSQTPQPHTNIIRELLEKARAKI